MLPLLEFVHIPPNVHGQHTRCTCARQNTHLAVLSEQSRKPAHPSTSLSSCVRLASPPLPESIATILMQVNELASASRPDRSHSTEEDGVVAEVTLQVFFVVRALFLEHVRCKGCHPSQTARIHIARCVTSRTTVSIHSIDDSGVLTTLTPLLADSDKSNSLRDGRYLV